MLKIPLQITRGDTVVWRDNDLKGPDPLTGRYANYNPEEYSLSWGFRSQGQPVNITAISEGSDFVTTLTGAATAQFSPGPVTWQASITRLGNRLTICTGILTVKQDLITTLDPVDSVSETAKMLQAVNDAIQSSMQGGAVKEYEIKGRRLDRYSLAELIQLRQTLKIELQREQAAAKIAQGYPDPRRVFVRFGR